MENRKLKSGQRESKIILSIKKEVGKKLSHDAISDCSELNCSTYCSDHHDAD